ncbi:MAG: hypothetical protein V3R76_10830 [Gammaproteobacteria bacterium]
MSLFSSARKDTQIGVDFLPAGVAVAQVRTDKKSPGKILLSEYLPAVGQAAQIQALQGWVRKHRLQKSDCVCLIASDDYDVYQIEKPIVEEAELTSALTWRIKDLINYEVTSAVVDSYPLPISNKNNIQQISVVCAHESTVGFYVDSIKSTGLTLSAIDIHDLVSKNLPCVHQGIGRTQAILSLDKQSGVLSIFHDTDLYVSRDFKIGIDQITRAGSEDESEYDSLLLEIQRSMDYFESYYGIGPVSNMSIFPRLPAIEKLAGYLQNFTSFDIDFVTPGESGETGNEGILEAHCFHAYCAALRDVQQ